MEPSRTNLSLPRFASIRHGSRFVETPAAVHIRDDPKNSDRERQELKMAVGLVFPAQRHNIPAELNVQPTDGTLT